MEPTKNKPYIEKICCEPFKQIIHKVNWFSYTNDEGEIIMVMPNVIGTDGNKYRINHCPSCGSNIRELKLTKAKFIKLMT